MTHNLKIPAGNWIRYTVIEKKYFSTIPNEWWLKITRTKFNRIHHLLKNVVDFELLWRCISKIWRTTQDSRDVNFLSHNKWHKSLNTPKISHNHILNAPKISHNHNKSANRQLLVVNSLGGANAAPRRLKRGHFLKILYLPKIIDSHPQLLAEFIY